jgi:NAD(P)-dependent dehydrogenase (short-subunit alcohol dehydrogenase family)
MQRNAIVTGAVKGIGRSISEKLVHNGHFVFLVDIDDECGVQLETALGSDKCKYYHCDIRQEQEVDLLLTSVARDHGQIDVLVNNAGIIKDNMIWNMSADDFDSVLDVNLKGTWLMCRGVATIMKEQKHGRIVNISSRAWLGNPGQSNYAASKAGVIALTRVLALELGKHNVIVNAVAPGLIDTPLTQALTDEIKSKLIAAQPTRSMGQPEDVANAVAFLASEETRFITGQTLYVDGGKNIGAGL